MFPATLRAAWANEQLPDWACSELGLRAESTFAALGAEVWVGLTELSVRLKGLLGWYLASRRWSIAELIAVDRPWPVGLDAEALPLDIRVKNAIWNAGLHRSFPQLERLRFGDLFKVRNLGPIGVLGFCCTLEAAIDIHQEMSPVGSFTSGSPFGDETSALLELIGEPWAEQVSGEDPRFRGLLPPGEGTLVDRIDRLTATPGALDALGARSLVNALPALRSRMRELEAEPLDVALKEFVSSTTGYTGDRLSALLSRLNWGGGSGRRTLKDVAAGLGITRERMRQLQVKVDEKIPKHPLFLPALDRALKQLESLAPIDVETASAALVKAGIVSSGFHPASVLDAAKSLGRTHSLDIRILAGRRMVVSVPDSEAATRIVGQAYRLVSASGAASVISLVDELGLQEVVTTAERAKEMLVRCGDFQMLDGGWFCCPNRPSEFVQRNTRRMLAVVSEIDIGTIREGLGRAFRFRHSTRKPKRWPSVPPPRSVLTEYYRAHADFVVSGEGRLRSTIPVSATADLAPAERVIMDVLRASSLGVMDRTTLTEECVARGVGTSTIWLLCSYSPVIAHVGTDLWSLRGVRVDPAAVEELLRARAQRPREDRITDHGWAADGNLWFACRLPRFHENLVILVPAAIRRYLQGKSFSPGSDNDPVRVGEDGIVSGYKSYLRRTGADKDDVIIFSFNLVSQTASLELDSGEYFDSEEAS